MSIWVWQKLYRRRFPLSSLPSTPCSSLSRANTEMLWLPCCPLSGRSLPHSESKASMAATANGWEKEASPRQWKICSICSTWQIKTFLHLFAVRERSEIARWDWERTAAPIIPQKERKWSERKCVDIQGFPDNMTTLGICVFHPLFHFQKHGIIDTDTKLLLTSVRTF